MYKRDNTQHAQQLAQRLRQRHPVKLLNVLLGVQRLPEACMREGSEPYAWEHVILKAAAVRKRIKDVIAVEKIPPATHPARVQGLLLKLLDIPILDGDPAERE